jgi:hypothetical protein
MNFHKSLLSDSAVNDIVDSLNDMIENHENALATGIHSSGVTELVEYYRNLLAKFEGDLVLNDDEIVDVMECLDDSAALCDELSANESDAEHVGILEHSARSYRAASAAVAWHLRP